MHPCYSETTPSPPKVIWIILFQESGPNNEVLTLKDYHVQPNSRIYLLVLLYAIPDRFNQVIFNLLWEYPESGRDYLDASVLLYSGTNFVDVIDFSNRESKSCPGVQHSGDVVDDDEQSGHHTIHVSIKSIPSHINKLIFTLSSWHSSNISKYPSLSLRFFDAKFPDKQLCDDKMSHVAYSQAIIMCCLINRGGGWKVFSLKRPSAGNVLNYRQIKSTSMALIEKGYI
ncbi:uncharacterized protein LOC114536695 [Dendronephthya gigantea]|uniref:uncharacterized protein LOC114536695 n=1 Tax=Dendronephthya gigantea TaxID=151771 RepID=UPI00106CEB10|nr:uncharacterized protein LOC114536695 [Dendronephthya gigantea]